MNVKAHLATAGEVRSDGMVFSDECLRKFAEENPINFSMKIQNHSIVT